MATIVIKGRHAQLTSRQREHVEEKLEKLQRYFGGISRIEAIVDGAGEEAEVELVISVPKGNPIVCHAKSRELYAAVDVAVSKAETGLTRLKEKKRDHRAQKAPPANPVEAVEAEELESYEEIVDRTDFSSQ